MAEVRRTWPVLATSLVVLAFMLLRLNSTGWDPVGLAEIGTRFSEGDPSGSEGYDGQFTYYMARDLRPSSVEPLLDVPAYRYQRILLPLMGRILALGVEALLGWSLLLINLVAHLFGTWSSSEMAYEQTGKRRYGLIYGMWAGLVVGVGADLHEPLAFGLAAGALWLRTSSRHRLAALLLGLALFAKETTALIWLAVLVIDVLARRWDSVLILVIGAGAFALFQIYLLATFGSVGIGSGGEGATPFELVPFLGFLRVARVDTRAFAAYLLVFGPGILLPAVWGLYRGVRALIQPRRRLGSLLLGLHAVVIILLPFSTFREPLGLVRISSGLILSLLVFAVEEGELRALNYSMFLPAYLALLIPGL